MVDVVLVVVDSLHVIKVAEPIADSILSDNDRWIAILLAHPSQESSDASRNNAKPCSGGEPGGGGGEGHPHV